MKIGTKERARRIKLIDALSARASSASPADRRLMRAVVKMLDDINEEEAAAVSWVAITAMRTEQDIRKALAHLSNALDGVAAAKP